MSLRLRVPPGTRLHPSASAALASLTASNTSSSSSSSTRSVHINPLTIQDPHAQPASPLTPSVPNTPTPAFTKAYTSFPFPQSFQTQTQTQPSSLASSTASLTHSRRGFHSTRQRKAKKGAEGRDEMDTESTEYSKSGSDAQSAAQQEAAFEPGRNSPEEEMAKAGEGQEKNNPLDASPANQEFSRPSEGADVGVAKGGKEGGQKASGGGSPGKAGKVKTSGE